MKTLDELCEEAIKTHMKQLGDSFYHYNKIIDEMEQGSNSSPEAQLEAMVSINPGHRSYCRIKRKEKETGIAEIDNLLSETIRWAFIAGWSNHKNELRKLLGL